MLSFEEIRSMSSDSFKKVVKEKAFEYEFSKLMLKKQPHSKMEKLSYVRLEMQDYLKQNSISSIGGRTIFRYRTHMANYRQNFGSDNGPINCPFCGLHIDNQFMAFYNCQVIKDNVNIAGRYEDIFKNTVPSDLVKTLVNIDQFRKENI